MSKFSLDIGLIDKITKKQEMSILEAKKIVENTLSNYSYTYNIHKAIKTSKGEDGSVFKENILQLEFADITKKTVKEIIELIKIAINLEGIWVHEYTGEEERMVW